MTQPSHPSREAVRAKSLISWWSCTMTEVSCGDVPEHKVRRDGVDSH